jgi:hypothetical protein
MVNASTELWPLPVEKCSVVALDPSPTTSVPLPFTPPIVVEPVPVTLSVPLFVLPVPIVVVPDESVKRFRVEFEPMARDD